MVQNCSRNSKQNTGKKEQIYRKVTKLWKKSAKLKKKTFGTLATGLGGEWRVYRVYASDLIKYLIDSAMKKVQKKCSADGKNVWNFLNLFIVFRGNLEIESCKKCKM